MMMQMEKFPEFSEPFLNSTNTSSTTYPETETLPIFSNPNNPMEPPLSLVQPQSQPHHHEVTSMTCSFPYTPTPPSSSSEKRNSMAAMREMIFRIAVMQPIHIDPESVKPPRRRNVKISKDPQSVAARHRRERISERIRILQRLVPGGTKMDTASMLDEAIHYVKFLKKQVQTLEQAGAHSHSISTTPLLPLAFPTHNTSISNHLNYSAFHLRTGI